MDARRATAAFSAAGIILIAGCGGGGKLGGTSLPSGGQGGLHNATQPANSSKVALKFMLPARRATGWTAPAYQPAYKQRRGKAFTPKKSRTASLRRKPQYLSEGLIGGSISISIYQGSGLALTQGPFTVGFTYGVSDFYCAYVPAAGAYQCSNYSSVFAPLGNDTFYAVESNATGQSLAATPDWPGTNYAQVAQSSYVITSSGYPAPISIQTYGIASYLAMDAPTSCVDPSGSPLVVEAFLADASGFPISGYLANPFTINVTGNFALYNLYAQQLTTPYTATYSNAYFNGFELAASASGNAGVVSVSSSAATVGINLTSSTSRNLYAVDRLALSPSTTGINVVGLVDSGPGAYSCGTLPMVNYATGNALTSFSNPVAIAGDDNFPGAAVLDNVSGTPYVTLADVGRLDFGDFLQTGGIVNGSPVFVTQVAGNNPLALAVSPSLYASGMVYILNADGSIQAVNDSSNFGATSTIEPAGTISGPVDISVLWNELGSFSGDFLFATSSNSANVYEIASADTSPSLSTYNVIGNASPTMFTPTTYAVSVDNIDGLGYISFLAFDSGNGGADSLVACNVFAACSSMNDTIFAYNDVLGAGQTNFSFSGGPPITGLVANGTSVAPFIIQNSGSPQATSAPLPSFGGPVTQIVSSYDGIWNGVGAGGVTQFFYNLGGTVAGSMTGTHATIVSPVAQVLY